MEPIYMISLAVLLNLLLVGYMIRKIIYIAHKKHLFDEPGEERKIHASGIPNLGGIAIFGSLLITGTFLMPPDSIAGINRLFPACLVLFALGLIDDLVGMDSHKKFFTQFAVALFTSSCTSYRIDSFYGLAGIYELTPLASVLFTALFLTLTINAMNLIDGINGLAGAIGLFSALFFSYIFFKAGSLGFLVLSVSLAAVLIAFLRFNITPARIFMGDTGAIVIGFLLGVFSLHYLHLKPLQHVNAAIQPAMAPAFICSVLLVPFFDTVRVFAVRIYNRKSPFGADRTHIHHRLIDLNLSHSQAVMVLLLTTFAALLLVIALEPLGLKITGAGLCAYILIMDRLLILKSQRRLNRLTKRREASSDFEMPRVRIFRRRKQLLEKTV